MKRRTFTKIMALAGLGTRMLGGPEDGGGHDAGRVVDPVSGRSPALTKGAYDKILRVTTPPSNRDWLGSFS